MEYSGCNGCGVCLLSCPVWRATREPRLTFCGRTRAEVGGAPDAELEASARACLLCGSCEPVCSMGIRTQQVTLNLRARLAERGVLIELPAHTGEHEGVANAPAGGAVLIPGPTMRADARLTERALAALSGASSGERVGLLCEDGYEIALTLESGRAVNEARLNRFLSTLEGAARVVVVDGLMHNFLYNLFKGAKRVESLGAALLNHPRLASALGPGDLYAIESRAYNAHHRRLVARYDALRHATGCVMNLDLHCVATPTGATSIQGRTQAFDVAGQVAWILEGRAVQRVVAEHPGDGAAFAAHAGLPVVHLAEVLA
jgi:ferredoxin